MHIVFVQPLLPSYSISFFNKLVSNKNIKVTVLADIFCNNQLNQYQPKDCFFDVVHLEEKRVGGFVLRPKLNKILAGLDYDHLVLNGNPRDLSQFLRLISQAIKGNPVYTWGMFHRIGGKRFISECYYRIAGHLSKACFTYTKRGVDAQLMRGIKIKKLIALGTAIDEYQVITEKNERSPDELNAFKFNHKLIEKKIILQVVRLSAIKKPELLIEAAKEVVRKDRSVLFVLIGGGDLEPRLKALVDIYELSDNVLFLGPVYDEKVLSFWFLSADVFVVPSCIGLSAHHAMCYELPIITDNDYSQQASEFEILFDGLNASLYQANDPLSLANKIIELLSDKEMCKFISKNALHTVTKISNLDNKVSNLLRALT
ncbi:glycosyltransferase [Shewanella frigidimarina]|uniref:glycosyltransferase n=1 Tax=Shewanella frigidimarina TaxID=56812 RepID=UPI003D79B77F